ncbi:hypothetical protein BGW80DRAFT_1563576 [Lactifluus volemus]|nr:hypothetical protein BGW80DRAFT_1563576 [Lactifluus volemus]
MEYTNDSDHSRHCQNSGTLSTAKAVASNSEKLTIPLAFTFTLPSPTPSLLFHSRNASSPGVASPDPNNLEPPPPLASGTAVGGLTEALQDLRTADRRRAYFRDTSHRRELIFGPEDVFTTDFCYGYIVTPTLSLQFPGGISFDMMRYWDGQPVRFTCCERKSEGDNGAKDSDTPGYRAMAEPFKPSHLQIHLASFSQMHHVVPAILKNKLLDDTMSGFPAEVNAAAHINQSQRPADPLSAGLSKACPRK